MNLTLQVLETEALKMDAWKVIRFDKLSKDTQVDLHTFPNNNGTRHLVVLIAT